jgi:cell division protein FtsL
MAEGRLMRSRLLLRATFGVVVLLGSLALVPWRQSRALEVQTHLVRLRNQVSVAVSERVDLERRIQFLESRARVVPAARERLGMHTPAGDELIILPADAEP